MKETNRHNILLISLFWFVSFLVLFRLFTKEYYNGAVDYVYTVVFHIPLVITVSINIFCVNKYLLLKKYLAYSLCFIVLVAAGFLLHYVVFDNLAPILIKNFFFISMPLIEILQYIISYLLISILFKLSIKSFELKESQFRLETENNKTQLANLKAQLNPHFLFNSLNNIYSITGKENNEARSYIIKLSDALRYMLYKTSSYKVKLVDEIEYLNNYVELEKLRLESNAEIEFSVNGNIEEYKIAPLILLPLIENCFKHCNKEKPLIKINLVISDNILTLDCANNKASDNPFKGGIGLENTKKRLNMLYEHKFTLDIQNQENLFKSSLTLELDLNGKI